MILLPHKNSLPSLFLRVPAEKHLSKCLVDLFKNHHKGYGRQGILNFQAGFQGCNLHSVSAGLQRPSDTSNLSHQQKEYRKQGKFSLQQTKGQAKQACHQTSLSRVQQEQFFWFTHQSLCKMHAASIYISSSQNWQEKKKKQNARILLVCLDPQFLSFPFQPVAQSTTTDARNVSPLLLPRETVILLCGPATQVKYSWHVICPKKSRCKSER